MATRRGFLGLLAGVALVPALTGISVDAEAHPEAVEARASRRDRRHDAQHRPGHGKTGQFKDRHRSGSCRCCTKRRGCARRRDD